MTPALNAVLADVFALYLKTKNFHWHMSGPHFRDNDADYVTPLDMLAELREDNRTLLGQLREAHDLCDEQRDVPTTSLIENWIGETERRVWFLFEAGRGPDSAAR